MGLVIDFPGAAMCPAAAEPAPYTFDRSTYRTSVEMAAQAFLDLAHRMVDLLDTLDGDPNFEPDDDEDDGGAEPVLAALLGLDSQVRWAGFEGGAA